MAFNSIPFVVLLVVTYFLFQFSKQPGWLLLAASVVFYGFAGLSDSILFAVMILINWGIGFIKQRNSRIWAACAVNIGMLALIKYGNLLFGQGTSVGSYVDLALPLGISFYVFQMLAYQVDVARGMTPSARGLPQFIAFATFFPHLVAGPIMRARELLPQIERLFQGRRRRTRLLSFAIGMICLGLFKKIVLADSLAPIVDGLFATPLTSVYDAWIAAYLFAFQIYFDFAGYSEIAVGAAYLLGVRIPMNFLTPYLSAGPREFWQRWHITLSTWFRDYLYIPLGGSRGGMMRSAVVLLAVMGLAGLWHGANLTFIIWGLCWGLYIALGRLLSQLIPGVPPAVTWLPHIVIVILFWVFFRSPNIGAALGHLQAMFGFSGVPLVISGHPASAGHLLPILGCIALMLLHVVERILQRPSTLIILRRMNGPVTWGIFSGLSLLMIFMPNQNASPFIYFRF